MKLLFVTQSTIGGTLEYFKLLIPRLAEKGDEITVACPSYGPMKTELERMGINVHVIEMVREISPVGDICSIRQLVRYIKSNDPQLKSRGNRTHFSLFMRNSLRLYGPRLVL